jgi:uncharacterized protein (DUF342 family)
VTIQTARETDPEIKKRSQKHKSVLDRSDRKIKSLQKKISALKRNASKEAEDDIDDADANAGAGNAFGGREEKKRVKNKSKN